MVNLKYLIGNDIKPGNTEVAQFIEQLTIDTQKSYLKLHRDWYTNERFARGDHWVVFNRTLNKIQTIPCGDGEIRRTVNKIRTQIRGVKNFIKRNQPRWEVHPLGKTDQDYETARKKNKILQYWYDILQFPTLLTETIVTSLKYSVGFLEGGVVRVGNKNMIKFWFDDTFDILLDPFAKTIQDCRFIIKIVKKPVSSIKGNKLYTVKEVTPMADSVTNYKQLLEREKYGTDQYTGEGDLESTYVKELWVKYVGEDGQNKIKVFSLVGNELGRVFEPKYRRYPFFSYTPERTPGAIYGDAWIKDIISVNKSLDKGTSQIEGYIQRMLAGKYLIKQGVEVSSITDRGAEKIYYKGSVAPSQLNLQPLPSSPFTHINNLERWIEESGGIREASLGRVPGSIQSGKGLEALQSADAGTVAEPIENLEYFLKDIAEFILELISDYTVFSEEVIVEGEKIKYIGGDIEAPQDVVSVKPGNVTVKIVPEVAYTEEVRFERMMQLAQMGLIDPQTVLEKLNISNVGDIVERVKKAQDEKFKQEMIKQKESHRTEGQSPEDTADLAHQENMQMASGQQIPDTPQALWLPEHTELHMAFIRENRDAYEQQKELFDSHITAEENFKQ